uniref:HDC11911 n=1 Tax=Drosophila melanogaster TaxID=7227 RepID=Q6IKP3_DROME|nr:TPA_inf: HDC11911 [Drosophila melanogaster]
MSVIVRGQQQAISKQEQQQPQEPKDQNPKPQPQPPQPRSQSKWSSTYRTSASRHSASLWRVVRSRHGCRAPLKPRFWGLLGSAKQAYYSLCGEVNILQTKKKLLCERTSSIRVKIILNDSSQLLDRAFTLDTSQGLEACSAQWQGTELECLTCAHRGCLHACCGGVHQQWCSLTCGPF